jgi:hypothetical protein
LSGLLKIKKPLDMLVSDLIRMAIIKTTRHLGDQSDCSGHACSLLDGFNEPLSWKAQHGSSREKDGPAGFGVGIFTPEFCAGRKMDEL